eukprot:2967619-Pyramimonas_sp.AAC.1
MWERREAEKRACHATGLRRRLLSCARASANAGACPMTEKAKKSGGDDWTGGAATSAEMGATEEGGVRGGIKERSIS